jgi:hypothetical protein
MTTINPGFYKFNNDVLSYAATGVYAPNLTLRATDHEDYTYPVDGWYWFDSEAQAEAFFEINGQTAARWLEFGAALVGDSQINQWFGGLFPLAPVLHGMISVGLGQAAKGDSRTFLKAWGDALAAGLITADLVTHISAIAVTFDLPQTFIAGLSGE